MSKLSIIAKNVGYIHELPSGGYGNMDLFRKQASAQLKYLFAITANNYQTGAGKILRSYGFRPHVTFFSNHGRHENLTLWYKVDENIKDSDAIPNKHFYLYNCSVGFNGGRNRILNLYIQKKQNEIMIKERLMGYKRLDKSPIWVRISKKNIK